MISLETQAELVSALKRRGFHDTFQVNPEELVHALERLCRPFETVGFGGSVTTRELGLPDACARWGMTVYDHWTVPADRKDDVRRHQLTADVFVTAVNAVTEDGIMVNADGMGNRVAATIYGPRHVVWILSANKIVANLDDAIRRIQEVATPLNAERLKIQVPCRTSGVCVNCLSEHRLDKVFSMFHYKPTGTDHTIFLLDGAFGY